ncbi:hypothetical protein [Staphylococcus hominis]
MNKRIKFYVYKIDTPILRYNKAKEDWQYLPTYFNFNILLYNIKNVLFKIRIDRIQTYKNSKIIVLNNFDEDYSINLAYGEFLTIAHGYEASSVEIKKLTKTKDFEENEGILNKVHFFIDKRNGHMYVEHDRNSVLTMNRIRSYFNNNSTRKFYYKEFNKLNENVFQLDTRKSLFTINLLEPIDFIQQLKSIKKMKDITIPLNIENYKSEKKGIISKLRAKAEKEKVGTHNAKIVLENFDFSKMSEELLNFIKFLKANNTFGELKVKGTIDENITRVFTPETSTRDIVFEANKNINGWASKDEVFTKLKGIIDKDNQLNINSLTLEAKEINVVNVIYKQLNSRLTLKGNRENTSYKITKLERGGDYKYLRSN